MTLKPSREFGHRPLTVMLVLLAMGACSGEAATEPEPSFAWGEWRGVTGWAEAGGPGGGGATLEVFYVLPSQPELRGGFWYVGLKHEDGRHWRTLNLTKVVTAVTTTGLRVRIEDQILSPDGPLQRATITGTLRRMSGDTIDAIMQPAFSIVVEESQPGVFNQVRIIDGTPAPIPIMLFRSR